jgi:hypothetical protein
MSERHFADYYEKVVFGRKAPDTFEEYVKALGPTAEGMIYLLIAAVNAIRYPRESIRGYFQKQYHPLRQGRLFRIKSENSIP